MCPGSQKVGTFLLHVDLYVTSIKRLIGHKMTHVLTTLVVTTESSLYQFAVKCRARVIFTGLPPSLVVLSINGNNNSS